jgi:hypothetical protein
LRRITHRKPEWEGEGAAKKLGIPIFNGVQKKINGQWKGDLPEGWSAR